MRFLVDANMPRSTLALLASLGHTGERARDLGLGHAPDAEIAARLPGHLVIVEPDRVCFRPALQ
jgi:predicted nuclease of predicted toxin-antitoxin system